MLSRDETRAFYDRFGARQDQQGFYEDVATRRLIAAAAFEQARAVVEFGCGTGRFAATLLEHHLPATATYFGVDLSSTMIGLARSRLARFGTRAQVQLTAGSPRLELADASVDRFVSNYVLDLLPRDDIALLVEDAWRVLTADGRLCLTSLTHGCTGVSRFVSWAWTRVHRARPSLVGGCRPIELLDFITPPRWQVEQRAVIVALGITSEVVIARKLSCERSP